MNFLAHLLLSKNDRQIMVGNFIGDFVKGNSIFQYDEKIQKGIRLHRAIDFFTDQHEIVLKSKRRLYAKFSHYSPVIVDVFYDHFVAKDWQKYSVEPLLDFTQGFYKLMEQYSNKVPEAVNNMLYHMKTNNWLYNYQFLEGIDQTLNGIAKRTRFNSKMETAIASLKEHYSDFQLEFDQFFPELQLFTKDSEKQ
ncbi:MAG: acyl carrier protein phosphodiesterase [Bacteroidota bacterium]